MIVILDYGMGNSASILNMLRKAGAEARVSIDKDVISDATAIILPGVGSFDNGMCKLKDSGVVDLLETLVLHQGVPFLGVCLGMQLLFESSDEGEEPGLGWLPGRVKKFKFNSVNNDKVLKVPHMGWNAVHPVNYDSLYAGLENEARFYFVHSYHIDCTSESHILATSEYGYQFPCSVQDENIWGAQFHPEKSHRFGIQFFKNFLKVTKHA